MDGLGNLGAWIAIHEARKKQLQESIEINQEFIDHFDKNFQPFMDTYTRYTCAGHHVTYPACRIHLA